MIPVETVVRKLVADCEFVILPGFGALLSHQIPARFDRESGMFSPPDKRLAFNESLKLDDGLLANYISRHEGISHSEAVAYVRHYVERLRFLLEQNGLAMIKGIGQFGRNSEGKLMFEPDSSSHFNNDWYGFQQFKAVTVNPKVDSTPAFSQTSFAEPVDFYEEEVQKGGISVWKWAAAACLIGFVCYFSMFFLAGQSEMKSSLNPFTGMFSKSETVVAPEREEQENPSIDNQQVEFVLEDSMKTEFPVDSVSTQPSATIEAPVATIAAPSVASGIRYHVIAGAFKGTKRAAVLAEEMKQKGFGDVTLLPADARSTKVKVSVGAYQTETEARQAAAKLKPVVGEVGWVFKQK